MHGEGTGGCAGVHCGEREGRGGWVMGGMRRVAPAARPGARRAGGGRSAARRRPRVGGERGKYGCNAPTGSRPCRWPGAALAQNGGRSAAWPWRPRALGGHLGWRRRRHPACAEVPALSLSLPLKRGGVCAFGEAGPPPRLRGRPAPAIATPFLLRTSALPHAARVGLAASYHGAMGSRRYQSGGGE